MQIRIAYVYTRTSLDLTAQLLVMERFYVGLHVNHTKAAVCRSPLIVVICVSPRVPTRTQYALPNWTGEFNGMVACASQRVWKNN